MSPKRPKRKLRLNEPIAYRLGGYSVLAVMSAVAWFWVTRDDFVCVKGAMDESLQRTISVLDGTIDLGIKLSVSLVAFGAAMLIGLKARPRLDGALRDIVFVALLMFGQSAFAGVVWKLGLANSWINQCLNLVAEPTLQRLFFISLVYFLIGLAAMLVLIGCLVGFRNTAREGVNEP